MSFVSDYLIALKNSIVEYFYPPTSTATFTSTSLDDDFDKLDDGFQIIDHQEIAGLYDVPKTVHPLDARSPLDLFTSVRESIYYLSPPVWTNEEIEKLGYMPIRHNTFLSDRTWNCLISHCPQRFEIALELLKLWNLDKTQLQVHLVTGKYDETDYQLHQTFLKEVNSHNVSISHLDTYQKENMDTFLDLYPDNRKPGYIQCTILDNVPFVLSKKNIKKLSCHTDFFIIMDSRMVNLDIVDYAIMMSPEIRKFNQLYQYQYPEFYDNNVLVVLCHYESIIKQLNYHRLSQK